MCVWGWGEHRGQPFPEPKKRPQADARLLPGKRRDGGNTHGQALPYCRGAWPQQARARPPCFVLSSRGAELDGCRALPLLLTVRSLPCSDFCSWPTSLCSCLVRKILNGLEVLLQALSHPVPCYSAALAPPLREGVSETQHPPTPACEGKTQGLCTVTALQQTQGSKRRVPVYSGQSQGGMERFGVRAFQTVGSFQGAGNPAFCRVPSSWEGSGCQPWLDSHPEISQPGEAGKRQGREAPGVSLGSPPLALRACWDSW